MKISAALFATTFATNISKEYKRRYKDTDQTVTYYNQTDYFYNETDYYDTEYYDNLETTSEPTTTDPSPYCEKLGLYDDHHSFQEVIRNRIALFVGWSWKAYTKYRGLARHGTIPVAHSAKNKQKTRLFTRWLTNVWDQSARHINANRKCATMKFKDGNPLNMPYNIIGWDCQLDFELQRSISGQDTAIDSICDRMANYFDWLYADCKVPPPVAESVKEKLTRRCERIKALEIQVYASNVALIYGFAVNTEQLMDYGSVGGDYLPLNETMLNEFDFEAWNVTTPTLPPFSFFL